MPSPVPRSEFAKVLDSRRRELENTLAPLLPRGREIVCELGAGHGHFLTAYAQTHPNEFCLGVDILEDRVARALRKRDRAALPNLHFLQAEATLLLSTLPDTAVIQRTFVLFPDPWPKTRHHKHRLIQRDFLSLLRSRSKIGTELFFRSDHLDAFESARNHVLAHSSWRMCERSWPFEFETVFQKRAPHYYSFCAEALP